MTETLRVKFDEEQTARIIYEVTEKLMLDANRIKVVRCKDCKHWKETVNGVPTCQGHGIAFITQAEDFCSYGERKENDETD